MGKRKAVRRFIDPKKDVCFKFVDNTEKKDDAGCVEFSAIKAQAAPAKEEKVSLKLTSEAEHWGIYFKDDYDYMQHLKERDSFNWADDHKDLSLAPQPHPQQKKKDRRAENKLQKNASEESPLVYYAEKYISGLGTADGEDDDSNLFSDTEFVDELPDNLFDILNGAVAAEEFCPDYKYDEDEEMEDEEMEDGLSNVNFMAEGEVDYSKMPPLEQLDPGSDEDSRSYASNDFMDVSSDEDDDDDDRKDNKSKPLSTLQLNDDNFPSLEAAKSITVKAPPKSFKNIPLPNEFESNPQKSLVMSLKDFHEVSDTALDHFFDAVPSNSGQIGKPLTVSLKKFNKAVQGDVDSFFDAVAEQSDEEGGYQDPEAECPMSGLPSSRTAAKVVTEKVDMLNEHFNAMMMREFKRSDVCGDGLDEVEGALDESAPQFRAAAATDRSVGARPLEGRVHLAGPHAMRETEQEKELKNKALNFCKNWRETKEELVEVAIPDRHAMMYNATNLPVVRNKNFPGLIKPDLPSYFNQKKKKGLTIKDIKAHDREMNAPKSNSDEDAQTYKTMLTELSYRPPDESTADRRDRKTAVRELRRGRREEKKQNQIAHKQMVLQTAKVLMHARHYRNTAVI